MQNEVSYSFLDLLTKKLPIFQDKLLTKIEIPKIQRDYVQGASASGGEALNSKGDRFLDAIFTAITEEGHQELLMDFVYGSVIYENDQCTFSPLDGQQRLTTLYLLYWYISRRESPNDETILEALKKFTYETRTSSRDFCSRLCDERSFIPGKDGQPSVLLKDCSWYFSSYNLDPTIKSMLLMLDSINNKYESSGRKSVLPNLERLRFYVLPLNKFKLSEELYVKMNARGKQLTDFENFKADLIQWMKDDKNPERKYYRQRVDDKPRYLRISTKIDNVWSEFIWRRYQNSSPDSRFYRLLCRWFLNEYIFFSELNADALSVDSTFKGLENETEYKSFDLFSCVLNKNPLLIERLEKFLDGYCNAVDIAKECQPSWGKEEVFSPFAEKVNQRDRAVLSGIQFYLEEHTYEKLEFSQWMRVLWNIAENTDITDLAAMIGLIKNSIIPLALNGNRIIHYLASSKEGGFRLAVQMEVRKARFINENSNWEVLFRKGESHSFFHGNIDFLLSSDMTEDVFINRLNMAGMLFDENGLSYSFSDVKHLAIRAILSNYSSFDELIGGSEYYGSNFPDKDEPEHYLKKHLSSDITFAKVIRQYCDYNDVNSMINQMRGDCSRESEIYRNEISRENLSEEEIKQANNHKMIHESLYRYEELQEAMQQNKATRIHREWSTGRFFASKPRSWYAWIVLDLDRYSWIDAVLTQNGFNTEGEIKCDSYSFYWGKSTSFRGLATYDDGTKRETQITLNSDGSISVNCVPLNKDISVILQGVNYYEMNSCEIRKAFEENVFNGSLPI